MEIEDPGSDSRPLKRPRPQAGASPSLHGPVPSLAPRDIVLSEAHRRIVEGEDCKNILRSSIDSFRKVLLALRQAETALVKIEKHHADGTIPKSLQIRNNIHLPHEVDASDQINQIYQSTSQTVFKIVLDQRARHRDLLLAQSNNPLAFLDKAIHDYSLSFVLSDPTYRPILDVLRRRFQDELEIVRFQNLHSKEKHVKRNAASAARQEEIQRITDTTPSDEALKSIVSREVDLALRKRFPTSSSSSSPPRPPSRGKNKAGVPSNRPPPRKTQRKKPGTPPQQRAVAIQGNRTTQSGSRFRPQISPTHRRQQQRRSRSQTPVPPLRRTKSLPQLQRQKKTNRSTHSPKGNNTLSIPLKGKGKREHLSSAH